MIAVFYSERISPAPLLFAGLAFAALAAVTFSGVRRRRVYSGIGVLLWALLLASGVDPVVAGLVTGLAAPAYSPTRKELEQATSQVRLFREQPTAELARSARTELTATISPNARLQLAYHRWTSYLIVPAFALANAGIPLGPSFISHASRSPVTLGVLIGYLLGKPLAIIGASWLLSTLSRGKVRAPVGWAAVIGSGTIAGIGFTVALLIATRAFSGEDLADAKLGALSAATVSALLTWAVYRMVGFLPSARKAHAWLGDATLIQDLIPEVDAVRDHVRGPARHQ